MATQNFWFNFCMFMMNIGSVLSQCNYFSEQNYESGEKQPVGRCIADYTKVQSRYYNCSASGESLTAYIFYGSTSCDSEEAIGWQEEKFHPFIADFECKGTNACDICLKVYNKCNDRSINDAYIQCFINENDQCNGTAAALETGCVNGYYYEMIISPCSDSNGTNIDFSARSYLNMIIVFVVVFFQK